MFETLVILVSKWTGISKIYPPFFDYRMLFVLSNNCLVFNSSQGTPCIIYHIKCHNIYDIIFRIKHHNINHNIYPKICHIIYHLLYHITYKLLYYIANHSICHKIYKTIYQYIISYNESSKAVLKSEVIFCQRLSSIKGCLLSKVVFHQRSSHILCPNNFDPNIFWAQTNFNPEFWS